MRGTLHFIFRSPNPSEILTVWPKYRSPKWRYLNFTAEESVIEENSMADRCVFWNEVLPELMADNENEDQDLQSEEDDVDLSFCKS